MHYESEEDTVGIYLVFIGIELLYTLESTIWLTFLLNPLCHIHRISIILIIRPLQIKPILGP